MCIKTNAYRDLCLHGPGTLLDTAEKLCKSRTGNRLLFWFRCHMSNLKLRESRHSAMERVSLILVNDIIQWANDSNYMANDLDHQRK